MSKNDIIFSKSQSRTTEFGSLVTRIDDPFTTKDKFLTSSITPIIVNTIYFVIDSTRCSFAYSIDNINWSVVHHFNGDPIAAQQSTRIINIVYYGGKYLFLTSTNHVYISTNMVSWTRDSSVADLVAKTAYNSSSTYTTPFYFYNGTTYPMIGYANFCVAYRGYGDFDVRSSSSRPTWSRYYKNSRLFSDGNGYTFMMGNGGFSVASSDQKAKVWAPLSSNGAWHSCMAVGGSTAVIAGSNVYYSSDYKKNSWSPVTSLAATAWGSIAVSDIVYGNGKFVAVGTGTLNQCATSTDGNTWTYQPNTSLSDVTSNNAIAKITFDGSTFVVFTTSGLTARSTDGVNWTTGTSLSMTVSSVVYANSMYVAVGNTAMVSTDAVTWYSSSGIITAMGGNANAFLYDVTYGNGKFVAVGRPFSPGLLGTQIVTSPDGVNWNSAGTGNVLGIAGYPTHVCWNGTVFVCSSDYGGRFATSTDGVTWSTDATSIYSTSDSVGVLRPIYSSAHKNGIFLAGTSNGGICTSFDGMKWTYTNSLSSTTWGTSAVMCATSSSTKFVVGGPLGKIATSTNGTSGWTYQSGLSSTAWGTDRVLSITYGNSKFVAVGDNGKVATSPDGVTWTYQSGLSSTTWGNGTVWSVVWSGTQFVVVGDTGKCATSPDGVTWTYRSGLSSISSTAPWYSVTYGNGTYIACGGATTATCATSTDGITWTDQSATVNNLKSSPMTFIGWASGKFVMLSSGDVLTSPNGTTWTRSQNFRECSDANSNSTTLRTFVFNGSYGFIGGDNGLIVSVQNGGTTFQQTEIGCYNKIISSVVDPKRICSKDSMSLYTIDGVSYSTDGMRWIVSSGLTSALGSSSINGIQKGVGDTYIAYGNGSYTFARSSDMFNWTVDSTSLASLGTIGSLNCNSSYLVASNPDGTKFAWSNDAGTTWTIGSSLTYVTSGAANQVTGLTGAINKIRRIGSRVFCLGAYGAIVYSDDNGVNWSYPVNTLSGFRGLVKDIVVHNSMKYVAISTTGASTSYNATTVDLQNSYTVNTSLFGGTAAEVMSIATDNTTVVVGGDSGKISTSPDGITWTYRSGLSSTAWGTNQVRQIIYAFGKFIAIGSGGACATSTDGITWTYQTGLRSTAWGTNNAYSVKMIGTTLYVVGTGSRVATSTDGVSWTYQAGPSSVAPGCSFTDIAYDATTSTYLISGINTTTSGGVVITSKNGISWSKIDRNVSIEFGGINSVDMASGIVFLGSIADVGLITNQSGRFAIDNKFVSYRNINNTFALYPSTSFSAIEGVDVSGSTFKMAGSYTDPLTVGSYGYITVGNINRFGINDGYAGKITSIAYGNSTYVATTSHGRILTSFDGISWSYIPRIRLTTAVPLAPATTSDVAYKVIYANSTFIVVGAQGYVAKSTDGVLWSLSGSTSLRSTTWGTSAVRDICWNGSKFVIVGDAGKCATSPDGTTWTYQSGLVTPSGGSAITCIQYGNSVFVAWSATGKICTSSDGITWTFRKNTVIDFFMTCVPVVSYSLVFGNGKFVFSSINQLDSFRTYLYSSTDGITWTASSITFPSLDSCYAGICYVPETNKFMFPSTNATATDVLYSIDPSLTSYVAFSGQIGNQRQNRNTTAILHGIFYLNGYVYVTSSSDFMFRIE